MKAIILNKPGQFLQTEKTDISNKIGVKEAIVRVHRVGICGTDLHAFQGVQPFFSYPRVLGHELGVEILQIGENLKGLKAGDFCAVEPYLHCGNCVACRRGKTNCCVNLKVLGVHVDGGLRESLIIPTNKLHKSNKLTLDQLALVEPLSIGFHAVQRANIEKGEFVLVVGAGPIGLSVIEFARLKGATVFVMDRDANRLAFCRDNYAVNTILATAEGCDLQEFMPEKPTLIFDATGNEQSMNNTIKEVANGGKIVFVGLHLGNVVFKDTDFHRREVTLMSSRNALPDNFTFIIQKMEEGVIDTSKWITHRVGFDDLVSQFAELVDPKGWVVKAVVQM